MKSTHEVIARSLLRHFRPVFRAKRVFGEMTGDPVQKELGEHWRIVDCVKAIDLSTKPDSYLAERTNVARLLRGCAKISSHSGASAGRADARRRDAGDVVHRRGAATQQMPARRRAPKGGRLV